MFNEHCKIWIKWNDKEEFIQVYNVGEVNALTLHWCRKGWAVSYSNALLEALRISDA